MRGFPILTLVILLSSAALAQTPATPPMAPPMAPPASAPPTAPPIAAPAAAPAASQPEGISRDDYIAKARAAEEKRAAKRFDAMDTDHDGILTKDEIAAYREAHARKKPSEPPHN